MVGIVCVAADEADARYCQIGLNAHVLGEDKVDDIFEYVRAGYNVIVIHNGGDLFLKIPENIMVVFSAFYLECVSGDDESETIH